MKPFINLFILVFFSINLFATSNYEIVWRLENPFRFFKDPTTYSQMQKHYENSNLFIESNENSKGLAFERLLQSFWKDKNGNKYISNGWASYFALNYNKTTTWNSQTKMYDKNYARIQKEYKKNIKSYLR